MSEGQSDAPKNWWEDTPTELYVEKRTPQAPIYPKGTDNPFHDFATIARSRFVDLELDGEATLPTGVMSYADLAKRGKGWKLHLNFDPYDAEKVEKVGTFLTALEENDAITAFKIGSGGGKEAGQPGKEATVYVGHRDKAQVVATLVEEALEGVLDLPEGDVIKDDISFTDKVMGRFEITNVDPEFHQYGFGAKGHPILNSDVWPYVRPHLSEANITRETREATTKADGVLRQRYGTFYTGKLPSAAV